MNITIGPSLPYHPHRIDSTGDDEGACFIAHFHSQMAIKKQNLSSIKYRLQHRNSIPVNFSLFQILSRAQIIQPILYCIRAGCSRHFFSCWFQLKNRNYRLLNVSPCFFSSFAPLTAFRIRFLTCIFFLLVFRRSKVKMKCPATRSRARFMCKKHRIAIKVSYAKIHFICECVFFFLLIVAWLRTWPGRGATHMLVMGHEYGVSYEYEFRNDEILKRLTRIIYARHLFFGWNKFVFQTYFPVFFFFICFIIFV